MPELAQYRSKRDEQVGTDIGEVFSERLHLSPDVTWDEIMHRELFKFARKFKETIEISPRTYICEYDFQPDDEAASRERYVDDFERFDMVDAAINAKVRFTKRLRPDSNGCYGLKLCVIHPALRRFESEDGRTVTLVNATLLVQLFK